MHSNRIPREFKYEFILRTELCFVLYTRLGSIPRFKQAHSSMWDIALFSKCALEYSRECQKSNYSMSRKDIEECMACTHSNKIAIAELQHFLEMARTDRGRSALSSAISALQLEMSVRICLTVDDKNLPTPVVSQNALNTNGGYVFSESHVALSFTSLPSFLWDQNLDYVTF